VDPDIESMDSIFVRTIESFNSSQFGFIVTIDDHRRDLSGIFAAGFFLRMMVIASGDVTSLRAPDREGSFPREGRFPDTAAV
jgi:hypothetical protein